MGLTSNDFFLQEEGLTWIRTTVEGDNVIHFLAILRWRWRPRNAHCLGNEQIPHFKLVIESTKMQDLISACSGSAGKARTSR